ncbi:hypothetical protein [Stieleria varia]|uniref:Uncharacterized protein n=1 Tax=Stieleria varia TaxID=2528005 RepID=A0A5C6A3J2_9BACT|nr:hypothetical protein [Stieleria varia]TWT93976.1 hypothetical protein Pla52n_58050 [Stieleria varia]
MQHDASTGQDRSRGLEHSRGLVRAPNKQKSQMKIIVILVLGLVLAVATQPGSESDSDFSQDSATLQLVSLKQAGGSSASNSQQPLEHFLEVISLPAIDIEAIVSRDLFCPPPSTLPAPEEPETQLSPQTVAPESVFSVRAVYGDASGSMQMALIDSNVDGKDESPNEIVRAGQPLPSGIQILSITEEGIQVAR